MQGGGDFTVFDELFADDYVDHTPQPGLTPDKSGTRLLYQSMRAAFQDFHAEIHWQSVDGDLVTTYKTYRGTRRGRSRASNPPAAQSRSTPLTSCGCVAAGSSNIGVPPTCCR